MGKTAVKLTSLFGNAVRPEAAPNTAASQTHKIDNYEIEKCLGTGGMGTVYRARDEKLDRVVALKVMVKDLRSDPSIMDAFRKEARAVAKLNHPNIAQIYSLGENEGKPYIVMEYVGGEHFDSLVFAPTPLDQAKVMKTGMEIASGLQVAADAGLVHGDIKPENIVFDDHGVPKLLDFGIASASNAKSTEIWGTPYYIAPEKLRRQRVDFRSDIYCLGATLYHALTKHPPFDGDDVRTVLRARLEGPPPPMSTYRDDIDPDVEAIVGRMLQMDPSDRYPTYGALIADIRTYLRRADPSAVQMDGMFVDEAPKKPRTPFFQDIKSQIMLLLVLIAMFPYIVFFYVKPSLFPAQTQIQARHSQPVALAGNDEPESVTEQEETANGEEETESEEEETEDNRQTVEPSNRQTDVADTTSASLPEEEGTGKSTAIDGDQEQANASNLQPSTSLGGSAPSAALRENNSPALDRQTVQPSNRQTPLSGSAPSAALRENSNPVPNRQTVKPSNRQTKDEVIDLTVDETPQQVTWPSIKVAAIIGGGADGGALVNGQVIPIGYQLPNGAVLRSVESQSATFEYKGQTKKFFVRKPKKAPQPDKNGNRPKGAKGVKK
jgi:serine/threonine protein kinase